MRFLTIVALFATFCMKLSAIDIEMPQDVGALEGLIDLHKWMIKEVQSRKELATEITIMQIQTTEETSKWDRMKDRLHDREKCLMNWVTFVTNLNDIRVEFEKIYKKEKEMLDTIRVWMSKTPDISSKKEIKKSYDVLRIQLAVGMIGWEAQQKFSEDIRMLTQLFLIQFGDNVTSELAANTYSLKNLTLNMATDQQRMSFVYNVLTKQHQIIDSLSYSLWQMKMFIRRYSSVDLVDTFFNYYLTRAFREKITQKVISTW